jgi:hypothetical protein
LINKRRIAHDVHYDSSSFAFPDRRHTDIDHAQITQLHCCNLSHHHRSLGFDPLGLIRRLLPIQIARKGDLDNYQRFRSASFSHSLPFDSRTNVIAVGSVSFGLQIGGEAAEVIAMAMTQKAIDSLFASLVKLGGDTSVALGPVGAGAKANVTADFISFAKSKGAYAGFNLEGSLVEVRDSLNRAYYGKAVRPVDIIVKKAVSNKGAAEFRATLNRATK